MEKRSWVCTVFTQVCVCVGLFVAFHLGQPREEARRGYYGNEVYFITVEGGVRPESKQNKVLKLMEKVARAYRVEFVVDIAEDGEDDVLLQIGTEYYRSLKIPWYTTKASTRGEQHSIKLIQIAQEKTLTLIGVDAGFSTGFTSAIRNEQTRRLIRIPMDANSHWNIYVGLHPVISCRNNSSQVEVKEHLDSLHHALPRYGVNAYLSGRTCTGCSHQGGINYIANPDPRNMRTDSAYLSSTFATAFCWELEDGILLHRVNSHELASYFINLSGEEVFRIIIEKKGKGVM